MTVLGMRRLAAIEAASTLLPNAQRHTRIKARPALSKTMGFERLSEVVLDIASRSSSLELGNVWEKEWYCEWLMRVEERRENDSWLAFMLSGCPIVELFKQESARVAIQ